VQKNDNMIKPYNILTNQSETQTKQKKTTKNEKKLKPKQHAVK